MVFGDQKISSPSSRGRKWSFLTPSDLPAIGVFKGWALSIRNCFRTFSMYVDWWTRIPFGRCSYCSQRQIFVIPRSFISNLFFNNLWFFWSLLEPLQDLKSLTYTVTIANLDSEFLIKTHVQIGLFTNPYFNKYLLRWLYHMGPNWFNPYKNLCSLIEYMLWDMEPYAASILYPSGIFMYISLFNDPYRFAVTTSIKHMSKFSVTTKLIKNLNVIASITGAYVSL